MQTIDRSAAWDGKKLLGISAFVRGTGREAGPAVVEFIQQPRAYVVQEFARGKEIDQIFGDLEESYRRVKALRKS